MSVLTMAPRLSVVFVNHDSHVLLKKALTSLSASDAVESIVVDNASRDVESVRQVCRETGTLLLRARRNLGYGRAANLGFQYARGRYLAVANPDLVFSRDATDRLVGFLEMNQRAGVVSPQLVYPDGTCQPSARRFPRLRYVLAGRRSPLARWISGYAAARDFLYAGLEERKEPMAVEAVIGAMMVFRREALEQVGGFDERYFMFAEDMDVCRRLRQSGWEVYVEPRVRVVHYYGAVRRTRWFFSEYHRIKGLWRFFCQGRGRLSRVALTVGFAGYLFALQAGGIIGLREYEYSWQQMGRKGRVNTSGART